MQWLQKTIELKSYPRGFHLVTAEIVAQFPELARFRVGLLHLFLQHTSASLTLNENADPAVRQDFASHFDHMVPEDAPYYEHTLEGSDDMPAHLKASLLGVDLTIPVTQGRLALGTWQGIYLCEHRNAGGPRRLVVTVFGDAATD